MCTAAVAGILLDTLPSAPTLQKWRRNHLDCDCGVMFRCWIANPRPEPYRSYGNGSAMRVSPAVFLNRNRPLEEALAAANHLSRTVDEIRPEYSFDETCPKTVHKAITCALESESFEDTSLKRTLPWRRRRHPCRNSRVDCRIYVRNSSLPGGKGGGLATGQGPGYCQGDDKNVRDCIFGLNMNTCSEGM